MNTFSAILKSPQKSIARLFLPENQCSLLNYATCKILTLGNAFYYSYSSLYIKVLWNVHKECILLQIQRLVIYAVADIQSCGIRHLYRLYMIGTKPL